MEEKNELIKALYEEIDQLKADLAEAQMSRREQDKYGPMVCRIGMMIPLEFFQKPESNVEQAVALLLSRYYSEMSGIAYNQNEKLNP